MCQCNGICVNKKAEDNLKKNHQEKKTTKTKPKWTKFSLVKLASNICTGFSSFRTFCHYLSDVRVVFGFRDRAAKMAQWFEYLCPRMWPGASCTPTRCRCSRLHWCRGRRPLGTHLMQNLAKKRAHLREVMMLHSVTAHLRAYLGKSDLASFWFTVLYMPCGRAFPFVVRHMYELTLNFTFQSCHLQKDWAIAQDTVCVGPRCQCAGQKTRSRVASIALKGCPRKVRVPEWVVSNGSSDLVWHLLCCRLMFKKQRYVPQSHCHSHVFGFSQHMTYQTFFSMAKFSDI